MDEHLDDAPAPIEAEGDGRQPGQPAGTGHVVAVAQQQSDDVDQRGTMARTPRRWPTTSFGGDHQQGTEAENTSDASTSAPIFHARPSPNRTIAAAVTTQSTQSSPEMLKAYPDGVIVVRRSHRRTGSRGRARRRIVGEASWLSTTAAITPAPHPYRGGRWLDRPPRGRYRSRCVSRPVSLTRT
jgi:hypothetical protein